MPEALFRGQALQRQITGKTMRRVESPPTLSDHLRTPMRLSPFHSRWILALLVIALAALVAWIFWALQRIEEAAPRLKKQAAESQSR
jgi:hypothetical protein